MHVHAQACCSAKPACPCCKSMMHVHAQACCASMLHVLAVGPWCMPMSALNVRRKSCPWYSIAFEMKRKIRSEMKWNVLSETKLKEAKEFLSFQLEAKQNIGSEMKRYEAKWSEKKRKTRLVCFAKTSETAEQRITFRFFRFQTKKKFEAKPAHPSSYRHGMDFSIRWRENEKIP